MAIGTGSSESNSAAAGHRTVQITVPPAPGLGNSDLLSASSAVGGTMLQVLAGVVIALMLALVELRRDRRLIRGYTKWLFVSLILVLLVGGWLWLGFVALLQLPNLPADTIRIAVEIVIVVQCGLGIVALVLLWLSAVELFGYLKSYEH